MTKEKGKVLARIFGIAMLLALALAFAPEARAAGVVATCDEASLLGAILGGGKVTFSCSGKIVLSSTIFISDDTRIDGSGQNVTISGNDRHQIFSVGTRNLTLTLVHLTLSHARCIGSCHGGGAVSAPNNASINIYHCNFVDDQTAEKGGAIYIFFGILTARYNSFSTGKANYGGAIYAENSSGTVTKSSFHANSASQNGGAIYLLNAGLDETADTFDNNGASFYGGGIYTDAGYVVVTNSTFYQNGALAGGGLFADVGTIGVSVVNSSFAGGIANAGLGGNIYNRTVAGGFGVMSQPFQVANSIFGGVSGFTPTALNCAGADLNDNGGNLRWPKSDTSCVGTHGDPEFFPLQNYGGPTQTLAVFPGSAAINRANDGLCPPTDQRGILRPQGKHCDIGAYEYNTAFSLATQTLQGFTDFLPQLLSPASAASLTNNVLTPLSSAVTSSAWGADGNHLTVQGGAAIFNMQQTVVANVSGVILNDFQQAYIENLVLSARTLAQTAIVDAGCGVVGAPAKCALATADFRKGDRADAMGDYTQAIQDYQNAWQTAVM